MSENQVSIARPSGGRVAFVGAGPGDASLLTLAAVTVVADADLVLAASADLVDLIRAAEIAVRPGVEVAVAELGSAWLDRAVELVGEGGLVARLVPEDPLMDAAAADEAAACRGAGLPIEIVPGIPALTAVPEFAGVALRPSSGVQLVTVRHKRQIGRLALTGMIVVRAPSNLVDEVVSAALEVGRDPSEPVVMTVKGATVQQSSVTSTLGALASRPGAHQASDAEVVVVIGADPKELAGQSLDWFESKPLFGWKVLVPRTKDPVDGLIDRLRTYGAESVEVPTMTVEPPRSPQQLERAVHGLIEGRYGWVAFTSPTSVVAIREKFEEIGLDARAFSGLRLAAVGVGTIEALHAWGLIPDLVPTAGVTVADLAAEFPAYDDLIDPMNRVFVPRADAATEALSDGLTELGWEVEEVVAVRTVRAAPPSIEIREAIKTGHFDAVAFVSSSAVRNLVGIAGKPHSLTVVAAIGTATARTCEEHGLKVEATADVTNQASLADALARYASEREATLVARGKKVQRPSERRRARRKSG